MGIWVKGFLVLTAGGVITAGALGEGTTGSGLVLDKAGSVIDFAVDVIDQGFDAVGRLGDTVGNNSGDPAPDGS